MDGISDMNKESINVGMKFWMKFKIGLGSLRIKDRNVNV